NDVGLMVTVDILNPYYIKISSEYIRVILAYQYFSLLINNKVYHFVPIEGQEILVNRKTKQVVKTETKFAFQKGKDVIYMTMKKLSSLSDVMDQVESIVDPYYVKSDMLPSTKDGLNIDTEELIKEMEEQNVKRLIGFAIDERDEQDFHQWIDVLKAL